MKFPCILCATDGIMLGCNKKAKEILDIARLNRDASIFNYMPQLFWSFYKFDISVESVDFDFKYLELRKDDLFDHNI